VAQRLESSLTPNMAHQLEAACSITRALQSQLRVRRLHVEASLMEQIIVHIDTALEARRRMENSSIWKQPEIVLPPSDGLDPAGKTLFQLADRNGDGAVDREEFAVAMRALREETPNASHAASLHDASRGISPEAARRYELEGQIHGLSSQTSAEVARCIRKAITTGHDVVDECRKQRLEDEAVEVMRVVERLGEIGSTMDPTGSSAQQQEQGLDDFVTELDRSIAVIRTTAAALEGG
jgi:hypothetical protein